MKKGIVLLIAGLLLWSAQGFAWVWPDDPYVNLGGVRNYLLGEYALTIEDQLEVETFFEVAAESATVVIREAGWAENEAFGWYREGSFKNEIVPVLEYGTFHFDTGPEAFGFELYGEFNPRYGQTSWFSERSRNTMHGEDPNLQHVIVFPNYKWDPEHPGDLEYRIRVSNSYVLCWEDMVRNPESPFFPPPTRRDFDDFIIEVGGIQGVLLDVSSPEVQTPKSHTLAQNYPNPFNAETNISFDLPRAAEVSLKIYSLSGQTIETLIDGKMEAGRHTVTWDASGHSSGIYFYKLSAGEVSEIRRMALLK
jgi:hypothetical protein